MKKFNKYKKYIVAFLLIISLFLIANKLHADSGWDSDYDSGWSSSDWGSSSWDSDWGYSGGGSSFSGFDPIIIFIIVVVFIVYTIVKGNINNTIEPTTSQIYKRLSEEDIRKTLPDFNKEEFLKNSYNIFIVIQNAWTNFDYDTLRQYLSDELFNTYKSQLRVLNTKKQKNMMHNFVKYDMDITGINKVDNKTALTVELIVSFYDYVVDKDDNVVRGSRNRKLTNHYELTFICSENKKKKNNKCPNCGAPFSNKNSNVCPYCGSTIVSEHYDWILSKKEVKK